MSRPPADGPAGPGLHPAWIFAALTALFGSLFALATPPLQAPDESRHLARSFAIADGQLLASDEPGPFAQVTVPRAVAELPQAVDERRIARHPDQQLDPSRLRQALAQPLDPDDRVAVRAPSLYSPLPYLPQAAAIALARLADVSAAACVYLARFANLLVYLAVGVVALLRTPAHGFALLMVATLPMAVFEAGSLGADASANALALLLLASILRVAARQRPIRARECVELGVIAALLGLTKQAYAPLVLAVAIVPTTRFATTRAWALGLGAVVAAGALPALLWFGLLQTLEVAPLTAGANPQAQLAWVLAHPFETLGVFTATTVDHADRYVRTFIGHLGQLDVRLPGFFYTVYPAFLVAVALTDSQRRSPVHGRARATLVGVVLLTGFLTLLMAYVGWNKPGDHRVRYFQGRYFLPLAPFLLCALHVPRLALPRRVLAWACAAGSAGALGVAAVLLVQRYWG